MDVRPLILTLSLDETSQAFFDALRIKYFPRERNFLRAHCTFFHALPGEEMRRIKDDLRAVAREELPFGLRVAPPKSIGRGVAFPLEGIEAPRIHTRLQQHWSELLSSQDRQRVWPHVTVQNKVAPDVAKTALAELSAAYAERAAVATGLRLWAYLGGPWQPVELFPFTGESAKSSSE